MDKRPRFHLNICVPWGTGASRGFFAFKGAMFAAYPGNLLFSKIDARNCAIGLTLRR
jgi:hypothetical protein